jgi:hypothetical protein
MSTPSAVKQARYRDRQRDARVVYRIEVERDAVIQMLVDCGRLSRQDAEFLAPRRSLGRCQSSDALRPWAAAHLWGKIYSIVTPRREASDE